MARADAKNSGDGHTLRLGEEDARVVLWARALEDVDRRGVLVPAAERRRASETAGDVGKRARAEGRWLVRRSRALVDAIDAEALKSGPLAWVIPGRGLLLPTLLVSLLVGLSTQALGPRQQISVLAVPLLGLVVWNLVMVSVLLVQRVLPLGLFGASRRGLADRLGSWWQGRVRRLVERGTPSPTADGTEATLIQQARGHFLEAWLPSIQPLALARLRRLLHAAALTVVAGAVAGMYVRGLVWEYRVTWESTFLAAATLDPVLSTLLAPASALTGIPVPSVEGLEAPATGDAAPWIHLWAATAALFVGVPRGLLWLGASLTAGRLARRVPVRFDGTWRRRLLASREVQAYRVDVLPFSHAPTASALEALRGALYDILGPRADIVVRPSVAYGDEAESLEALGGRLGVALFTLAQTPELEVHGEWITHLASGLADEQALLVLVDGAPYRQRLGEGEGVEDRLDARRRAWDRVVREAGPVACHLDLGSALDPEASSAMVSNLWPEGAWDRG